MADVYATIEQADQNVVTRLADVLELRAADLQQRAMLEDYLTDLPLQACADAVMEALVHDRRLVRRLPALVRDAGYEMIRLRSHGYSETAEPSYMLTIVDRGADALVARGRLGTAVADALKAEARRRAQEGTFFGHIAYASLIARKAG